MTINTNTDTQRAAALMMHYSHGDVDGFNAVVAEAYAAGRVMPLLVTVLDQHEAVIPVLCTELGLVCVASMRADLHRDPNLTDDTLGAIWLITAHARRDLAEQRGEVGSEPPSLQRSIELLNSVLWLFSSFMPVLYCDYGLSLLAAQEGRE